MKSAIFQGRTTHTRHLPKRHAFAYRLFWLALELDELVELDRTVRGFGFNRRALVSVRDADHGGPGAGDIRSRIEARVREAGVEEPVARWTLVTIPRVAGYVFNPVSFYLGRADDGGLAVVVAEVRNTFGEMHHYVARPRPDPAVEGCWRFGFPKVFYVSPFLKVDGRYELTLRTADDQFDLAIDLLRREVPWLSATLTGRSRTLTGAALAGTLARLPWCAATIMLRIHWQALRLWAWRRIGTYLKTPPQNPATIPSPRPNFWHRLRGRLVAAAARPELTTPAAPSEAPKS